MIQHTHWPWFHSAARRASPTPQPWNPPSGSTPTHQKATHLPKKLPHTPFALTRRPTLLVVNATSSREPCLAFESTWRPLSPRLTSRRRGVLFSLVSLCVEDASSLALSHFASTRRPLCFARGQKPRSRPRQNLALKPCLVLHAPPCFGSTRLHLFFRL